MSNTENDNSSTVSKNQEPNSENATVYENPAEVEGIYCEIDTKTQKANRLKLSAQTGGTSDKVNLDNLTDVSRYSTPADVDASTETTSRTTYENLNNVPPQGDASKQIVSSNYATEVPLNTPPSVSYINIEQSAIKRSSKVQRKTHLDNLLLFENVLFLGEIIFSLLSWILLVTWSYADMPNYCMPCPLGYSLFVFVTSWITTTCWFICLISKADETFTWLKVLREPRFGIPYNVVWLLAYFIGGIIEATFAVNDLSQILGASTSFAFILVIVHTLHALVYFRRQYGKLPCQYLPGWENECVSSTS